MLVRAVSFGDWFPHSSLKLVYVEPVIDDADGLYELLEVSADASTDEIRAAAKRKMLLSHPDVGGDTEEFIRIHHAYTVLSDPESKALYDRKERDSGSLSVCIVKVPEDTSHGFEGVEAPCFYKDMDTVLSENDLERVRLWQGFLMDAAHESGAELVIKAGISKSLSGYDVEDDIAVIGLDTEPVRWAAQLFILREMSKPC